MAAAQGRCEVLNHRQSNLLLPTLLSKGQCQKIPAQTRPTAWQMQQCRCARGTCRSCRWIMRTVAVATVVQAAADTTAVWRIQGVGSSKLACPVEALRSKASTSRAPSCSSQQSCLNNTLVYHLLQHPLDKGVQALLTRLCLKSRCLLHHHSPRRG